MKAFKRLMYILGMLLYPSRKKHIVCSFFYKIKFGKNVRITGFPRWGSEGYLIEIGDNVTITQDVVFHTHDGGVHVFRDQVPGFNIFGRIIIGNNVFIGSNVIIMPNVSIGNNVVIGSGSLVTRNIEDNVVAVGSPAKPIKTIDEYKTSSLTKGFAVKAGLSPAERQAFILSNIDK